MMENLTNEDTIEHDVNVDETIGASVENVEESAGANEPVDVADGTDGSDAVKEEIMFQRIMSYKAYRRGMILTRVLITAAAAFALVFTVRIFILLGVILPVIAIIIGAISILVSMGNERNYTVYNTRVVIKRRGDDARRSVPIENIVSVKYKSAFYEKRMCVGTITIKAKNARGKVKTYKLKHVFDAMPLVEYLTGVTGINTGKTTY